MSTDRDQFGDFAGPGAEHHPTPWTVKRGQLVDRDGNEVVVHGFNAAQRTSSPTDKERGTGAFILRAVNSHEPLVEALRFAIGSAEGQHADPNQTLADIAGQLRDVLAKHGGDR